MKKFLLLLLLLTGVVGSIHAQDDELDQDELLYIAERVVLIGIVEGNEFTGNGSGTIIAPSGIIFTNRHVVEDADDLLIFMLGDIGELPELRYRASVVEVSEQIDFAIIQIDRDAEGNPIDASALELPFLPLEVASASIGEEVRVFGYPGIGDGYMVITAGEIVTIQNGSVNGERVPVWYRTDSEFSGGNSGDLAVNNAGQPVGIPTWVVSEDRTAGKLGGLLPFSTVLALIEDANNLAVDTSDNTDIIVEDVPEDSGETVTFTLENGSLSTVCFVFISPTTATSWGDDQLGAEEAIGAGTSRSWELAADFYDILLLNCNGDQISDTRNVDLTENTSLTYTGDAESEAPPPASGQLSVSCGQTVQFDNGVEVRLSNLAPGEQLRVTTIGLNSFDPVLAVFDSGNEGRCSDDAEGAAVYSVNLPTSGITTPSSLNSQLAIEAAGPDEEYSVIVGGYDNQTGEFLVIIEGASLSEGNNADLYAVNASSLGPNTTVTAYMIATSNGFDPAIYLTNSDFVPLTDADNAVIYCDDAGNDNVCWNNFDTLDSNDLTLSGGAVIRGGTFDSALQLTPENIAAYGGNTLRLLATSYQQSTFGDYVLVLHIGNQ